MTTLEQNNFTAAEPLVPRMPGAISDFLPDTSTPVLLGRQAVSPLLVDSLHRHAERAGSVGLSELEGSAEAAKVSMMRTPQKLVFIAIFGALGPGGAFESDPDSLPHLTILNGTGHTESVEFTRAQDADGADVFLAHRYANY